MGRGNEREPFSRGRITWVRHQSFSSVLSRMESEKMMFSYSILTPGVPSIAWSSPGRIGTMEPAQTGREVRLTVTEPEPFLT